MAITEQYRETGPTHLFVPFEEWFFGNHIKGQKDKEAHDHNYLELAFILSGSARHVTIGGVEKCGKGDLLIIPLGAWHSYSDSCGLEVVNCLLSPSMLQNELAWLAADAVLGPALGLSVSGSLLQPSRWKVSAVQMRYIRPLLEQLLAVHRRDNSRVELLGHLLLLLARVRSVVAAAASTPVPAAPVHPSVARAVRLLNDDIAREWSLGELAHSLRLNPSYLVRLFRTHTGLPPMKYLDKLRAGRAATLLFASDLPIGRIGERVGWAEPKLFARQFRQHFGQSATRYRSSLLGGG